MPRSISSVGSSVRTRKGASGEMSERRCSTAFRAEWFFEATITDCLAQSADVAIAAIVWLLPVPGGPVTTERGALIARTVASICSILSGPVLIGGTGLISASFGRPMSGERAVRQIRSSRQVAITSRSRTDPAVNVEPTGKNTASAP